MKVIMNIVGIDDEVTVSIPDKIVGGRDNEKEASAMAIERVCMIKETDIDIVEII